MISTRCPCIVAQNNWPPVVVTWCYCQGQGRLDGAICEYNEEDKMSFLREVPPYLHLSTRIYTYLDISIIYIDYVSP